jgi:hypothetical protein
MNIKFDENKPQKDYIHCIASAGMFSVLAGKTII